MSYPVNCTALLVIDPVNDFLSEGGAGDPATKQAQPFLRTKANSQQQGEGFTAGPRRPVECKFSLDGEVLYVVDIGVIGFDLARCRTY